MGKVWTVLKYLSVVVIIGVLFYFVFAEIGLYELYSTLRGMNPLYLILAFLSCTLYMFWWNLRGYYIMRSIKKIKFLPLIPIFLAGMLLNTITPGARAGGEPVKAVYLSKRFKITKTKAFAATILNIIYNFFIFSLLSIFSILFVILYIKVSFAIKVFLLVFLFGIPTLLILLFLLRKRIQKIILRKLLGRFYHTFLFTRVRERFKTHRQLERYLNRKIKVFSKFIKKSLKNGKRLSTGLGTTIGFYIFRYLTVYLLFLALGHDIRFIPIIIVITLATLFGDLSFTPGGMGITEGLMIALYLAFRIDPAVAVIVTFIDRAMFYFYALFLGTIAFIYMTLRRSWG
jgi:uncharacterized protein (TIRG00374 family)